MGKLRDSLIAVDKILNAVGKEVGGAAAKFETEISNSYQLMQVGSEGIDSLYVYLKTKVKKAGQKWKDVEKQTIDQFSDANVKKFVAGIADFRKQAMNYSLKWGNFAKGLDGDLKKTDALLADIAGQISKKKKKWLQSQKFKTKIAGYEKAFASLQDRVTTIKKELKSLLQDPSIVPPSPNQIKKVLDISEKSTLADLEMLSSRTIQQMLQKYKKAASSGEASSRKFRQAGDFKAELKIIAMMVKEADEMESEAT